MIYIGNGFSANMVEDNIIKITTVNKKEFEEIGKKAYSIIGHLEIAEHYKLKLNRETIQLKQGDILYIVTPSKRPSEGKTIANGASYRYIPEEEGHTYKKIEVI